MGYKKLDMPKVEEAVKNLLIALGEDIEREGLKETPRRVAKYWAELLEGEDYSNEEIAEMFRKDFNVGYDSIVITEVQNVYSNCEHHTVLFHGDQFCEDYQDMLHWYMWLIEYFSESSEFSFTWRG